MSKINKLMGFILRAIVTGLALAFIIVYLWPAVSNQQSESQDNKPVRTTLAPASYAEAINRTAPAVVSIYTNSLLPQQVDPELKSRIGFHTLYRMTRGQGSGVILSKDGYIITNHHVINGVSGIQIGLWDGRLVPARVVGSDPATDLAVIKINIKDLPVAPVSENPYFRVGDVVFAIGNSLGLSHTVSMGIISATGRNDLNSLLYEDFIQTDAAINSGNSGGALINSLGELVGINALNLNSATGAQNIGFAIPISLAVDVMQQIIENGTVLRGWLGANFSDLRRMALPDGSASLKGVGVREVQKGGPAWNAGIRQGDIITTMDNTEVSDASQFLLAISQREPGSQVELEVMRKGQPFQTYATLIQQPPIKLK